MWTALYRKNDNYGLIIQIADFKSLCEFEVRTPMIGGLKIVIVVISVLISIFIRSLLCARHCSKCFLYINSFSFHNSCLTCILKLVPDYN